MAQRQDERMNMILGNRGPDSFQKNLLNRTFFTDKGEIQFSDETGPLSKRSASPKKKQKSEKKKKRSKEKKKA